jgi:PAS domain S-box-containing protein
MTLSAIYKFADKRNKKILMRVTMITEVDFFDGNFHKIIDLVSANIYWKDTDGRYLGCNQHVLDQFGLKSSEEIIGKNDYEVSLFAEKELVRFVENDQFAHKYGFFEGEEHVTINGKTVTYLTKKKSFYSNTGEIVGIMTTSLDITNQKKLIDLERKKAEEQVKAKQIIDVVNASIYWKDKEGRYLGCNKYVLDMAGVSDISEIVGKTDNELVWNAISPKLMEVDNYVICNGPYVGEELMTIADGSELIMLTVKNKLVDSECNVIGVVGTSLDITAQKEAERLQLEAQKFALQEKEKFIQLAHKVAHDISSPLTALTMMMHTWDELPESKRSLIKRATESILDIANNLLSTYRNEEQRAMSDIEQRQPLLVSDLIIQLMSEKKVQYINHSINFETAIANDAWFAFSEMQTSQFRRSLSNLINNAVDALDNKKNGLITVRLAANVDAVVVKVEDNGKGLSFDMIEKMKSRFCFTEGKENGHGLGLQQVWDTLEFNQGIMEIQSTLGKGTSIQLTFPRTAASKWITQDFNLNLDSIIVILDDDESIHTAWNLRFGPFLALYPILRLHHFTQGQEVLNFFARLSPAEKEQVVFLSDYELLHQEKNGLQIVEASAIKNATLVTSYYSNPKVREALERLRIQVLPKQMAAIVPIYIKEEGENVVKNACSDLSKPNWLSKLWKNLLQ